MWVGTGGGLAKFDGVNWTIYNSSNSGLLSNSISSITIDGHGYLWIGHPGGISVFTGSNWKTYDRANTGFPANNIRSITIDQNGSKWIGTSREGMYVFNETGIPSSSHSLALQESGVNIFPNPTFDYLNIELESNFSNSYMEIFNSQGILVKSQKLAIIQNEIDMRDLFDGLYIIRIHTKSSTVIRKVVKNNDSPK
jgi:ligand-binding sensor domain-containing protein